MILPFETEAYWFIALIYLVMYSDSDHIPVAHFFQQRIEQIVHTIYKVTNRIWWRCGFGNWRRIKTDLPLRSRMLNRL